MRSSLVMLYFSQRTQLSHIVFFSVVLFGLVGAGGYELIGLYDQSYAARLSPPHTNVSTKPTIGFQPELKKAEGILAVSTRQLMIWNPDGRIQLGNPENGWGEVTQLPMTYVTSVASEESGAILGGSLRSADGVEVGVIVRINDHGAILQRWTWLQTGHGTTPEVSVFHWVASREDRRWATLRTSLFTLKPDGTIERTKEIPSGSILLLGSQGRQVLCTPANLTKAHSAPAFCASEGGMPWQAEGRWVQYPLICGHWLIEPGETNVVVRALNSGSQLRKLHIDPGAAIACHGNDELIVGRTTIRGLRLPKLSSRWQVRMRDSSAKALASFGNHVAVLTTSGSVTLLSGRNSTPLPSGRNSWNTP
jgi:hypothetical protein